MKMLKLKLVYSDDMAVCHKNAKINLPRLNKHKQQDTKPCKYIPNSYSSTKSKVL